MHRERRARRARARSPRGSALFHPVAQWRVEHRVIGPGRDDARARARRRRPRSNHRAPSRRRPRSPPRARGPAGGSTRRGGAGTPPCGSPTSRQNFRFRLRPVCPRARRHFKVRVANTPAARRRGAEVDVELGRQRHELRGQRRGAQPRRGLWRASVFFAKPRLPPRRPQGHLRRSTAARAPVADPVDGRAARDPSAAQPRRAAQVRRRRGARRDRGRWKRDEIFVDALPEARDRVLVPGAVRLRDAIVDRPAERGDVRGVVVFIGTPLVTPLGTPSGAATTTDDILTGDSTTLDSNSPCSPSAFHLHILSLQLMHEDRAPRPGLSLAAPGRCAPTPNSASVAPGPSAAPVSSLAPVLPAPRLAAVLARLLTRGTAVDAFVASSEVRALNIDASPHGDCDTYMCTLTPGRSEHHGRVRSRAIAPPTMVFSERSGRKMETRGFSSARVRPAATSLSISSYMYSTSALRARTSACESASARPSEHRRSAPRHSFRCPAPPPPAERPG